MTESLFDGYLLYEVKRYPRGQNPFKRMSASYVIEHMETGKMYIGSTNNLATRVGGHASDLRLKKHRNKNLQELYDKYDGKTFRLRYKDAGDPWTAIRTEQKLVTALRETGLLLNVWQEDVTTPKGTERSDEHRQKLREAGLGRHVSDETKAKLSAAGKGRPHSPEHTEKLVPTLRASNEEKSARVSIEGFEFSSIAEASRRLRLERNAIRRRLDDVCYPNWIRL